MKKWYETQFRRNLVDMHIEDWEEEFLSRFDPDDYFQALKRGHIGAPMLYLQAHTGLCYWPTKSGKMHNAFKGREDAMKRLADRCHAEGMDVIAYYSLIFNNWAHKEHPGWRIRDVNGHDSRADGNRYGLCCPNNLEYRDFVAAQIEELCGYFDFEGIFLDMTFWPKVCYCESCRARWEKEVGGPMPAVIDWNDENWVRFQEKRSQWLGEFADFATGEVKRHKPDCAVEHQYSTAINHFWRFGVNENITLASDYAGGDLYGGIAEQSFACKAYYNLTQNQPFEYMTSRCYPSLKEHTTTKSMDLMRLSVMMTYLHHGACLLIDAIDPRGTMDMRVYEKIGEIFRETEPYEPYLSRGKLAYDVGVYLNMRGKMDTLKNGIRVGSPQENEGIEHTPHEQGALGAANCLRTHHIPYTVLTSSRPQRIKEANVLVLSDAPMLSGEEASLIREYIREGGKAYLSGRTCPELVEELFGIHFDGYTEETVAYLSPTGEGLPYMQGAFTRDYPLVMFEPLPVYSGKPRGELLGTLTLPYTIPNPNSDFGNMINQDGEEGVNLDTPMFRFASIHSNPPGRFTDHPALVRASYGKGEAIWCAAPIERAKREQHSDIFAGLIRALQGEKPFAFSSDGPETVEGVLFDDAGQGVKLMGIINLQEGFHTLPVYDFSFTVQTGWAPSQVCLLPERKPLPFLYADGKVTVHFDRLELYAMYEIKK